MNELGKALDIYLHKYDHILLIDDFNSVISKRSTYDFCKVYQIYLPVLKTEKTHPLLTFC